MRFGERLRIEWVLDPAVQGALLPPLLLQPLVENAVKHGVEPSASGASLRIRSYKRGGLACIDIDNTLAPPGSGALPCPTGHGIALANVRDRLRLLHDVQGQFSAGPHNGGYRVHIGIPL